MLFNSFQFLIFFPTVVFLYFILPHRFRWLFLLIASYYFYMNWKPVYALLIFISTLITWGCGILLEKYESKKIRRLFLSLSLLINFGILFFYKYFNFLNESVSLLLEKIHLSWNVPNLDLLLPVGISFYTFQAVGYTVDVYRRDIKAERNFGIYALFISFFPQLAAGPIERAKNFLPQFYERHKFDLNRLEAGIKQMAWGYFMKVVVADRLALIVNAAYNNSESHSGTTLLVATLLFSFQIYCDFAGYSNIAIGSARIMGFDLMTNFKRPYFSTNISEFWQRWHISLSTWFKDYLYIPLGGNRVKPARNYLNVLITFIVSGIWHGANWTFVVWGALHGLYNVVQRLLGLHKLKTRANPISMISMILFNFAIVSLAWIFFRANNVSHAFSILGKIFFDRGPLFTEDITTYVFGISALIILLSKEFLDEFYPRNFKLMNSENPIVSAFFTAILIITIISLGVFDGSQFIYFQF